MTKVPPALPQLRAELGLSLVESTFIVTTFNVLGMLVGVLAGMLSDRFGRKRLALAGLVLMAVGGAVGAMVQGFTPLLLSRFVEGVGFILFAVPAPALMSTMSADARDRAKALGLWSACLYANRRHDRAPRGATVHRCLELARALACARYHRGARRRDFRQSGARYRKGAGELDAPGCGIARTAR